MLLLLLLRPLLTATVRGWRGGNSTSTSSRSVDAACIGSDCRRQINDGVSGELKKIRSMERSVEELELSTVDDRSFTVMMTTMMATMVTMIIMMRVMMTRDAE